MISRFFKKTPSRVELPNNTPYPLRAGRRLRAIEEAKIVIPAGILEPPGTPLSELVRVSDDDPQVGLVENPTGVVSHIIVVMKPGMDICLGRNSEILIQAVGTFSLWDELT